MHHQYRLLKNMPVKMSGHGRAGSAASHEAHALSFSGSACTRCATLYQTAAGGFVTQQRQREEQDHQAADDKADAVDGVGYGNRLQTAEDGVAAADNTDDDTQKSQLL